MRVLLLHPEDRLPAGQFVRGWDLIVDFGRAPGATYQDWSRQEGCPIISVFEFARGIDDLRQCRKLLRWGTGCIIDRYGIDWWDILSLGLVPDFLKLLLVDRLAKYIDRPCDLYLTRPFPLATALQNFLNCTLTVQARGLYTITARLRHYSGILSKFDAAQLSQIIQDKFDRHHAMRSKLLRTKTSSTIPVVLLPSAYVNVSRMAVRYAELLPEHQFLLVFARASGKLPSLPANVSMDPLDAYFESSTGKEEHLLDLWRILRRKLIREENLFAAADRAGMLETVESGLRWGARVRDAWHNVFDRERVVACLCADDTNPYTRIPLRLAKSRGVSTVACHHGALDCWMALKNPAADSYLAKTEMECDYLTNACNVGPEKIVMGGPGCHARAEAMTGSCERNWLVFFTEPYEISGWRNEEIYIDLLPRLLSLAENRGLKLVFKLHPFESTRGHRKKLRRILGRREREIEVLAGPLSDDLWHKIRFALTVESSVALECAERGIPVFLCTWMRDPYSGYAQQYAKFGVGQALESPEGIADIPELPSAHYHSLTNMKENIAPEMLRQLFTKNDCLAMASNG